MNSIAIDLGGTIIKLGIVSDGKILAHDTIIAASKIGLKPSLAAIQKKIEGLFLKTSISIEAIAGVGVGFPGLVDSKQMKVISTNKKYEDAETFDFIEWAKNSFGKPLFLENDARVALLGEWKYGAGKGQDNLAMMTLGTGVGTAVIMDGNLMIGKHFQAGCLGGHFTINVNGETCTCGNQGCVEAEASSWQLANLLKADHRYNDSMIKGSTLDFEQLFKYANKGGVLSLEMRDKCLEIWSACAINLIHAYDPDVIILGGGIIKSADIIIPFIQERVDKLAWTPWGKIKIIASEIPSESALLGAHYLVEKSYE